MECHDHIPLSGNWFSCNLTNIVSSCTAFWSLTAWVLFEIFSLIFIFFPFLFLFFFLFELEKSVWREADLYLKHSKIVLTRWYKLVIICKHEFLVNGIGEVYLMEFLLSFNTSLMSCVCIALIWLRMKNAVCTLICCG